MSKNATFFSSTTYGNNILYFIKHDYTTLLIMCIYKIELQ